MSKIVEIYELVKVLTSAEKRYFKRFTSLYGKGNDNNYVLLFDVIDKSKNSTEHIIKKKYEDKSGDSQHFPFTKNYLYKHILKSLVAYHSGSDVEDRIEEMISAGRILYKKSLENQSKRLFDKALQLAGKEHNFVGILKIYPSLSNMLYNSNMRNITDKDLERFTRQELSALQSQTLIVKIRHILMNVMFNLKKGHLTIEEIKYINARINQLEIEIKASPFFYPKLAFDEMCTWYYISISDYEKGFQYSERMLELTKQLNPATEKGKSRRLMAYRSCMVACLDTYRMDKFHEIWKENNACPATSKYMEASIYKNSIIIIDAFIKQGKFDEALRRSDEFKPVIRKYGLKSDVIWYSAQLYLNAYIAYGLGQYDDCMKMTTDLLNNPKKNFREDYYQYVRLLQLVCAYEIGYYDFIESSLDSVQKYLLEHSVYKTNLILIKGVKVILQAKDTTDKKLKELRREIEDILSANPKEVTGLVYINSLAWLTCKIEKIPYSTAVQQAYQKLKKEYLLSHRQGKSS